MVGGVGGFGVAESYFFFWGGWSFGGLGTLALVLCECVLQFCGVGVVWCGVVCVVGYILLAFLYFYLCICTNNLI